jgi:antitoxin component YwqK of YwqJK toxin-antitoxin module
MKRELTLIATLFLMTWSVQAQKSPKLYQNEGVYYRDRGQNELYTGEYREYYDNNTLKLEMQIKNGLPEGTYIIYFENRKPKEIRCTEKGNFMDYGEIMIFQDN